MPEPGSNSNKPRQANGVKNELLDPLRPDERLFQKKPQEKSLSRAAHYGLPARPPSRTPTSSRMQRRIPDSYRPYQTRNGKESHTTTDYVHGATMSTGRPIKSYADLDAPMSPSASHADGTYLALETKVTSSSNIILSYDDDNNDTSDSLNEIAVIDPYSRTAFDQMPDTTKERMLAELIRSIGARQVDFHKFCNERDPARHVQAPTDSQIQIARPRPKHEFQPGDIVLIHRMELTTDTRARIGDKNITASNGGLHSDKTRPILPGELHRRTGYVSGWEVGTRNEMGMETVRHKQARMKYYHLKAMEYSGEDTVRLENGKTVRLNRTGRSSLIVKDIPPGPRWSKFSHMNSESCHSFRVLESHKFMGRLTPTSLATVLRHEAKKKAAAYIACTDLMEPSHIKSRLAVPSVASSSDHSVSGASGDDGDDTDRDIPTAAAVRHTAQKVKNSKPIPSFEKDIRPSTNRRNRSPSPVCALSKPGKRGRSPNSDDNSGRKFSKRDRHWSPSDH